MIRPEAVATISTLPKHAQTRATQNNAMTVPLIAPAIGGGGVSTISSAAGRKASSSLRVDRLERPARAALERLAMRLAMLPTMPRAATEGTCGRSCGRPPAPLDGAASRTALADFMDACLQT